MNDLGEKEIEAQLKKLLPTKLRWTIQELAERLWGDRHRNGSGPGQLKGRIIRVLNAMKRRGHCSRKGLLWSGGCHGPTTAVADKSADVR